MNDPKDLLERIDASEAGAATREPEFGVFWDGTATAGGRQV